MAAGITALALSLVFGAIATLGPVADYFSEITSLRSTSSNDLSGTPAKQEAELEEESEDPHTNERGNIELQVGKDGAILGYDNETAVTIKATEIVRSPACTPDPFWPLNPKNGELIAVKLEMTTMPDIT